jgi:hypothetical protein
MKHFSAAIQRRFRPTHCGVLLLALSTVGPTAWAQSFGPVSTFSAGADSQPIALVLGDLNGDGRLDVVTANSYTSAVGVLLGQAGGTFAAPSSYATNRPYSGPNGVALGDVNGDGRLDIASANFLGNAVTVFQAQAGGGFIPVSYTTGAGSVPLNVVLADVDGDGRLDLVTANNGPSTVGVLRGLAGGGFAAVTSYAAGTGSGATNVQGVVVADVTGDGRPDLVTNNSSHYAVGVLPGLAGGGFAPVTEYYSTYSNGPATSLVLADVNRDGRLDAVTACAYSNADAGTVLLGQPNGFVNGNITYSTGTNSGPKGLALGDVNGDGRLDIVTANFAANTVGVLLGQATGGFAAPVAYPTGAGTGPTAVVLGDLNGDRRLDIVVANYTTNAVAVLLNTGTFTPLATAHPTVADFALYPNPAHNVFTVQLPAGARATRAELLNALGQVVRQPAVNGANFQVATSGLASGVYSLRLTVGGAILTKRVVVQ